MKNLINCGTCGYPLTPEERTTLVEKDGVMVKPAPVREPALVIYQGEIAKSNLPKGFTGMLYTTAIKQARSAPVQDPLEYWNAVEGWVKIDEVREHFDSVGCGTIYKTAGENRVPVYTTPPTAQRQWVGLTDEQINNAWLLNGGGLAANRFHDFSRAIEAKLKEMNT